MKQQRRFNIGRRGVWPTGRDEYIDAPPPKPDPLSLAVLLGLGTLFAAVAAFVIIELVRR